MPAAFFLKLLELLEVEKALVGRHLRQARNAPHSRRPPAIAAGGRM